LLVDIELGLDSLLSAEALRALVGVGLCIGRGWAINRTILETMEIRRVWRRWEIRIGLGDNMVLGLDHWVMMEMPLRVVS
jgi:hypothetical protein